MLIKVINNLVLELKMPGKAKPLTLHELINVALKAKDAGIKVPVYLGSVNVTAKDLELHACDLQHYEHKLVCMDQRCDDLAAIICVTDDSKASADLRERMFAPVSQTDKQTKALLAAVRGLLAYAKHGKRRS